MTKQVSIRKQKKAIQMNVEIRQKYVQVDRDKNWTKDRRVGGKYKEDLTLKSTAVGQKMHLILWTALGHKKAT